MNNELFIYWIPGQARNDGGFDCRSGFKILCVLCGWNKSIVEEIRWQ